MTIVPFLALLVVLKVETYALKLYFRVHHQDHFALDHESQDQEYIKLGPNSHLKKELDEYIESLKTAKSSTIIKDQYSLQNNSKSFVQKKLSTKYEGTTKRMSRPWHAPFTERISRIKHFLSDKFFGDSKSASSKESYHQHQLQNVAYNVNNYTSGNVNQRLSLNNTVAADHSSSNGSYYRQKRSKDYINANEGWDIHYSTTGKPTQNKDDFEITEKDIREGEKSKLKLILTMIFVTLGVVVFISLIVFCFVKDPKTFCIAFGSGCPCLLYACPCLVKRIEQYLEPNKLVQDKMNTYMPGVIIHEDGKLEHYKPTPDEIDCIMEIIDEIAS